MVTGDHPSAAGAIASQIGLIATKNDEVIPRNVITYNLPV
jgi:magnesium-transporting ATPase (P-type)